MPPASHGSVRIDNGRGFHADAFVSGSGLQFIADRIDALNGTLDVDSSDDGTRVRAVVPLRIGSAP
jgi:signal transduction histidine kinase